MNKKLIEYLIIAIAVILLILAAYSFIAYKYAETEYNMDSITLRAPTSSSYEVSGSTIEFTNPNYPFYNLNITKTDSDDSNVKALLKSYKSFKGGSIDYINESCYLIYVNYPDRGFDHHTLIIPVKDFDKDSLTFKNNSTVWLFDANNREFVLDSTYNSKVEL